jgi:hypothetical protein
MRTLHVSVSQVLDGPQRCCGNMPIMLVLICIIFLSTTKKRVIGYRPVCRPLFVFKELILTQFPDIFMASYDFDHSLWGLVVRVPGYRTKMYCASCEVRTEFIYIYISYVEASRPPLWSSGQSSCLQIQRSWVRFPTLPDFLRSSGSGKGSTQPHEYN